MPNASELELPTLRVDADLVGPRFHETVTGLLEEHWLARTDVGYVVLDRDAVDEVLRTRSARMPAIELLELQGVTAGPIHDQLSGNLLNLHGEAHRRLRGLVNAAFTPQAAARLRPAMRAHLHALFAEVAADGACDVVSALAKPYPARMIAEIVGAPVADAARLGEWAYWIQSTFDPTKVAGEPGRIEDAAAEFHDYVDALLDTRHEEGADLLGLLAPALADGELTRQECISLVGSVLIGGVDTTQAQLSHAVRLLAEHPDQWAALRADDGLVLRAVDEVLRFEPIAPFTARLVTETFTLRDVTFEPDTVLVVCATTANRDPGAYHAPERFDLITDRGGVKPLSFGAGHHFCLGHALARAELEEALAFLATRVCDLRLDGPPDYDSAPGVYGLRSLPVTFTVAEAPTSDSQGPVTSPM